MKNHLLIIDPQVDFCQPARPALADAMKAANNGVETEEISNIRKGGALCVPGADADSARLAAFIRSKGRSLDRIHLTLDSHHEIDVGHSPFWSNSKGEHPGPFVSISNEDITKGVWFPTDRSLLQRMKDYTMALETNKRYPLLVWPTHCIIGTWGYQVMPNIARALSEWNVARFRNVNVVTKGSNPYTEHYSALQADVPDPTDITTGMNTDLLDALSVADKILIAGQALSHCVRFTIMDIAAQFGDEATRKFVLLRDCTSSVPGFEAKGEEFVNWMRSKGCLVTTSTQMFA